MSNSLVGVKGPFANMSVVQRANFETLVGKMGVTVDVLLTQNPVFKRGLLALNNDNYTPPERTPWGGEEIPKLQGKSPQVVGEFWANSGHEKFPSGMVVSVDGQELTIPLNRLSEIFPGEVSGKQNVDDLDNKMPFLVKLLNSGSWMPYKEGALVTMLEELESGFDVRRDWKEDLGVKTYTDLLEHNNHELHLGLSYLEGALEKAGVKGLAKKLQDLHTEMLTKNLSVQVHPPKGYATDKPSKTEAWYVVDAEPGAGIYLGLKDGVTKEAFEAAARRGEDVTRFLNFVEAKPGEIFYIPAGTIHAIGAGLLLVEPQETSETTFRVYDYGRKDKDGNPRELHVDDSIATIDWDAPRGDALVQSLLRTPIVLQEGGPGLARYEQLVKETDFTFNRATFENVGDVLKNDTSDTEVQGWIVLNGGVAVYDIGGSEPLAEFKQGDPFLFAATFGPYEIRSTQNNTIVVQTYRA
ncbi:MAG: hypothetical protein ABIE74_03505 [Pseudomonadota bacterium]